MANPATVPLHILRLGILVHTGWPVAALAAEDDFNEEVDAGPLNRPHTLLYSALALTWTGHLDQADAACSAAQALPGAAGWFAAINAGVARGRILCARGRFEEASEIYLAVEALVHRYDIGEPASPRWAAGAVDAAMRAGRTEQAERVVAWLEEANVGVDRRWPAMVATGGRAALAASIGDHEGADALYRQALATECEATLDKASIALRYGTWLHRRRQDLRARRVLNEAAQIAEDRGAAHLAALAQAELAAAGGRRHRHRTEAGLTEREAKVASMAASGATAREIASSLGVSPRTVETQLAHCYMKLGIGSRRELRQRRHELSTRTGGDTLG
jgi:DNA-binding CsgD family transcriptional regulator